MKAFIRFAGLCLGLICLIWGRAAQAQVDEGYCDINTLSNSQVFVGNYYDHDHVTGDGLWGDPGTYASQGNLTMGVDLYVTATQIRDLSHNTSISWTNGYQGANCLAQLQATWNNNTILSPPIADTQPWTLGKNGNGVDLYNWAYFHGVCELDGPRGRSSGDLFEVTYYIWALPFYHDNFGTTYELALDSGPYAMTGTFTW